MTDHPSPPPAASIESFIRTFVDDYVASHRSVVIQDAFDVAYGGCGPFAEDLVLALRDAFPGIAASDHDTFDMLDADPCLPRPEGFEYALHVYVMAETSCGPRYYDALAPQGVPMPSMLSFNAEQVRHARASLQPHSLS